MNKVKSEYEYLYADKKESSILTIIVSRTLPMLSWVVFILSLILQKAAENYSGIKSNLLHRNKNLIAAVLTPNLLIIYKWAIIAGIMICITIFLSRLKRISYEKKDITKYESLYKKSKYFIWTITISIFSLNIVLYYDNAIWIAYPWVTLSSLIMVIVQYIRLIYVILYGERISISN